MALNIAEILAKSAKATANVASIPYQYDPAKQVEGYKTRIEGAGVDPDEALDTRNIFQRMLNLNPNQGFLEDLFEVIDRPLNTFAGGLTYAITGKNMLDGMWKGLIGEDENTYIDVLKGMGIDSTSSFWIGTAANIFLDPLNWAVPGAGLGAQADDAIKLLKTGADALSDAGDIAKLARTSLANFVNVNKIGAIVDAGSTFAKINTVADATSVMKKLAKAKKVDFMNLAVQGISRVTTKALGITNVALHKSLSSLTKVGILAPGVADNFFSYGSDLFKSISQLFESTMTGISKVTGKTLDQIQGALGLEHQILTRKILDSAQNLQSATKVRIQTLYDKHKQMFPTSTLSLDDFEKQWISRFRTVGVEQTSASIGIQQMGDITLDTSSGSAANNALIRQKELFDANPKKKRFIPDVNNPRIEEYDAQGKLIKTTRRNEADAFDQDFLDNARLAPEKGTHLKRRNTSQLSTEYKKSAEGKAVMEKLDKAKDEKAWQAIFDTIPESAFGIGARDLEKSAGDIRKWVARVTGMAEDEIVVQAATEAKAIDFRIFKKSNGGLEEMASVPVELKSGSEWHFSEAKVAVEGDEVKALLRDKNTFEEARTAVQKKIEQLDLDISRDPTNKALIKQRENLNTFYNNSGLATMTDTENILGEGLVLFYADLEKFESYWDEHPFVMLRFPDANGEMKPFMLTGDQMKKLIRDNSVFSNTTGTAPIKLKVEIRNTGGGSIKEATGGSSKINVEMNLSGPADQRTIKITDVEGQATTYTLGSRVNPTTGVAERGIMKDGNFIPLNDEVKIGALVAPGQQMRVMLKADLSSSFINDFTTQKFGNFSMEHIRKTYFQSGAGRMNTGETTFVDLISHGIETGNFNLDQELYDVLKQIMADDQNLSKFNIDDILKRVGDNMGQDDQVIAYVLKDENSQGLLKQLLSKVNENKNTTLKTLSGKIYNPQFFSANDRTRYDWLTKQSEFTQIVANDRSLRDSIASSLDTILSKGLGMEEGGALRTNIKGIYGNGYLRHVINSETEKLFRTLSPNSYKTTVGALKGNLYSLADRKWRGYTAEINNLVSAMASDVLGKEEYAKLLGNMSATHINLFVEDVNTSFVDMFNKISKKGSEMVLLNSIMENDLLMKSTPSSPNTFILPIGEATTPKLGYTVVRKSEFLDHAKDYVNAIGGSGPTSLQNKLKKLLNDIGGGDTVMVDNKIYSLIGMAKSNGWESNSILKIMDWSNDIFKKFKLATPGFHLRNLVGNYTNLVMSGINANDIGKITASFPDAWKTIAKGDSLLTKFATGAPIDPQDMDLFNSYKQFVEAGFLNASYKIQDLEKIVEATKEGGNAVDKLLAASAAGNEYVDRMFRFSLFKYATDNPHVYINQGFNSATEYVRFTLFDPSDLTGFEKHVMRRVIPFYTFTKKNLVFQVKNLIKNPQAYKNLHRVLDFAYDAIDIDKAEAPDYQIDNMWIPIPFTNQNGEYMTFRANLPASDLSEWVNDPVKRLLSSLAPVIRAPFEVATNTQIYTGLPISEFEGQKGYSLPFLDRWAEYGLSQMGLDVPAKLGSDLMEGDIPNMFGVSKTNIEKVQTSKAYDELNQIRDLMSYYKQQGVKIPTLAELENKPTTSKFDSLLAILRS